MAGEAYVYLRGNLGADPELKVTPQGTAVCNFSVGSTPRIKKNEEWVDGETTWFRVTVWGKDAEIAIDALSKGSHVIVAGLLNNRKYKDKEGIERTSLEVNAKSYALVPKHNNSDTKAGAEDDFPW